jgi:hypothetical protein
VHVRGGKVTADIYRGLDEQPWKNADFSRLPT